MDLMPTLLDLAGCPIDPKMEGATLVPLWTGKGHYPFENIICEMWRDHWHRIAVRTNQHKLIWDSRKPDEPELYNLTHDPAEQHNISEKYPDITASLQQIVQRHIQRVSGTSPSESILEPELDESVLRRLRGLGYIE
jgi:arylsulfatase A-like enzyme